LGRDAVILSVWAQILDFWANLAASKGRVGCRGDTEIGRFSGRFGRSDQKSRFSGNISHFGVAATLFKIKNCGEIGLKRSTASR
jgi:hypothetical protein